MRKRSLVVMVLILCEILAQRQLTDGQDRNTGAVKTVITTTKDYLFSSGKWKADGKERHKQTYDSEGRVLENTKYSYFGGIEGLSYTYEHVYDELGRVKEVRHIHSGGLILDRYIYNYDEKGRLSRIVQQKPEGNSINRAYVYDDAGRIIQETYYERGLPLNTEFTTYNSDGSVEVAYQHKSDPVYHKSLTFYDTKQRPIKKLNYDSKGILEGQTIFKYDASGRLIQKSDYDAEGGLVRGEANTYCDSPPFTSL